MTKTRILPVYPSVPTGADLELFKSAKGELSLDYLLKPVRGLYGSPFRIIALRERPDFICDYAFVEKPTVESIRDAMGWALGDHEDSRAVTIVSALEKIFKGEVKEIAISEN